MLKNYIKIAWKVLLRRKFFTFVSLFGISFTLLVLMVVVGFIDHLFSPARPGSKLDRCLFVERIEIKGEKMHVSSFASYYFLDRYVRTMKRPEAVSIHSRSNPTVSYVRNQKLEFQLKYTDAVFWDIMEFSFIDGRPYDSVAVENADYVAVIDDRTKRQAFGDESAVGKYLETTDGNYRVVGVIPHEEIPTEFANADIYIPITTSRSHVNGTRLFSSCRAAVLAASKSDFPMIKSEFAEQIAQAHKDYEGEYDTIICDIGTQYNLLGKYFLGSQSESCSILMLAGIIALMILFMLFPAINLVNINVSRIIERSSEIGIRKAFGASSLTLIGQFVVENVVLTLLGGAIAYVLALIAFGMLNSSGMVPFGHLAPNIRVFIYSLALCLFFGIFSGVLPAYKMSRLHPAEALKGSEI
jgi:putative ABC transport system permease protein